MDLDHWQAMKTSHRDDVNPYKPPSDSIPQSIAPTSAGRFIVTLIPAAIVAAVGSSATTFVAAITASAVIALLPIAISFSLSVCLVCRVFATGASWARIALVLIGCLLSLIVSAYFFDQRVILGFAEVRVRMVMTAAIGASTFSIFFAIARIVPFSFARIISAWFLFALSAFIAFITFLHFRSSPHASDCVFWCSMCFQAIVVSSVAMLFNSEKRTDAMDELPLQPFAVVDSTDEVF